MAAVVTAVQFCSRAQMKGSHLMRAHVLQPVCKHCDRLEKRKKRGVTCKALSWSTEQLIKAQEMDKEIAPVLEWKCQSDVDLPWPTVSTIQKSYYAQWDSLCLVNGVLYRLWETPSGD